MPEQGHREFKSMNLQEFVNSTVSKFEVSVLRAEKEKCVTAKSNIEKEFYSVFLDNLDEIVEMLGLYDKISYEIGEYNQLIKSYNDLVSSFEVREEHVHVDKERQDELFNLLDNFADDMLYFKSQTRYLVHFDMFRRDDKNVLVVLSNDLIIIGESRTNVEFRLLNVLNYSVVNIDGDGCDLTIKTDHDIYRLTKDEEAVAKMVGSYEELTFTPSGEHDGAAEDASVEFLVRTEQYERLERELGKVPQIYTREQLRLCLGKMAPEMQTEAKTSFLTSRFKAGLLRINKIRPLTSLVDEVFDYFWRFQEEQRSFLAEFWGGDGEAGPGRASLIQSELDMVSKFLEKRIFYNFEIKSNLDVMKKIEGRLANDDVDLRFFMSYFNFLRNKYFKARIEGAKSRLESVASSVEAGYSSG